VMAYFAGVKVQELPTSIVPPVRTSNPIVAIGTSQQVPNPNEPKLIYSFDEYVSVFGYTGDYNVHTLDEVADVAFKLYKVAPIVFISIGTDATDITTYTPANLINAITRWIDQIFFLFRMVPGTLIIPKGSQDPSVAIAMASNMEVVSSLFQGMAIADIPDAQDPSAVAGYKNTNNLIDDNLILAYPSVEFDGKIYNLSTHIACMQARIDARNDSIPYMLASNQNIKAVRAKYTLTLDQANNIRGNGIVTAVSFIGGLRSWGDRTSAYPSSTDPAQAQIVIKRMNNWLRERLIRTYWQFVDQPLSERLLKTIRDSVQSDLNGLKGRGIIIDGRVEVLPQENPLPDLIDGLLRFHIYWTPSPAVREIDFLVEFDPTAATQIFRAIQ